METLEDDCAELENYSLWNWQPVKIIPKCQCYALKLPQYESCKLGQRLKLRLRFGFRVWARDRFVLGLT